MKYPKLLSRINDNMAALAGALFFLVAIFQSLESILRYLFAKPPVWVVDVSRYILIWAVFLGSAYGFQEKGHVSVDFIQQIIANWNIKVKKVLTVVGYLLACIFIGVIGWRSISMIGAAMRTGKLTMAYIQIPIVYLYLAMLFGSGLMLVTVVFIILSVIGDEEKYLY
ncbi:MAG: TRAP transporter small permease subunit [Peptococcaceae bacterium]|nr:TRAP transporter small permease subunit [Peptococcaceae bacterium]MDH7525751.1 TRAP transporter small permease subunit [Peptococcaceae bacterium]